MEKKLLVFVFWGLVLYLEFICLCFVRVFREVNFVFYVDVI